MSMVTDCASGAKSALERANCGPVYRRIMAENEPAFTYTNATNVFHFSPVD